MPEIFRRNPQPSERVYKLIRILDMVGKFALNISLSFFVLMSFSTVNVIAAEAIYPEGLAINVSYDMSDSIFTVDDTLIITRSLVNGESGDIHNFYLVDILPEQFDIISHNVVLNGDSIACYFEADQAMPQFPEYILYEEIFDHPLPDDTLNIIIHPLDSLVVAMEIVCLVPNQYLLPFHTLCGYIDSTGFFSTSPEILIEVTPAVGIDEQSVSRPERTAFSFAYPNPFNNETIIKLENYNYDVSALFGLQIYDLTGRLVFESYGPGTTSFHWRPESGTAGGIYFYTITNENIISSGKVVYLK